MKEEKQKEIIKYDLRLQPQQSIVSANLCKTELILNLSSLFQAVANLSYERQDIS